MSSIVAIWVPPSADTNDQAVTEVLSNEDLINNYFDALQTFTAAPTTTNIVVEYQTTN